MLIEFKVPDVAKICNVSEETVRRWVRSNRLQPINRGVSRKEGSSFNWRNILEFTSSNPKYVRYLVADETIELINEKVKLEKEKLKFEKDKEDEIDVCPLCGKRLDIERA